MITENSSKESELDTINLADFNIKEEDIIRVKTEEEYQKMLEALKKEEKVILKLNKLSFDLEFVPSLLAFDTLIPSLVQISTEDLKCYVLDIHPSSNPIAATQIKSLVKEIFGNQLISKLAIGLKGDIKSLKNSFGIKEPIVILIL